MSAKSNTTAGKAPKAPKAPAVPKQTPATTVVPETVQESEATASSIISPDASSPESSSVGGSKKSDDSLPTNIFLAVHKPAKESATAYIRKSDLKDVFAVHIIHKDAHDIVEVYFRNREQPLQIQTAKEETEKVSKCIRTHTRNHLNGAALPKKRNRPARGGSVVPDEDVVSGVGEESMSELE